LAQSTRIRQPPAPCTTIAAPAGRTPPRRRLIVLTAAATVALTTFATASLV